MSVRLSIEEAREVFKPEQNPCSSTLRIFLSAKSPDVTPATMLREWKDLLRLAARLGWDYSRCSGIWKKRYAKWPGEMPPGWELSPVARPAQRKLKVAEIWPNWSGAKNDD